MVPETLQKYLEGKNSYLARIELELNLNSSVIEASASECEMYCQIG